MGELIDTTEMFLKVIWELREDGIPPLRARVTERLEQSVPAVSQTVARMERDGLLTLSGDRTLEFSSLGLAYAMRVMRKHRLAELLLLEVLGVELQHVHEEACRWEHVLSRRAETGIVRVVADPSHDPFGNPVPGLAELGYMREGPVATRASRGLVPLPAGSYVLARLGEAVQSEPELVRACAHGGRVVGCSVRVTWNGGERRVEFGGSAPVAIPDTLARHVFVEP